MNMRVEAIEILGRWERGGVFAETLIEDATASPKVSPADRAFLIALVYGVLRHKTWLDHVIDTMATRGRLQSEVRTILRIGLCQLLLLKMPPYAAVNETVELSPHKARGLVNAILRRTMREEANLWQEWETLSLDVKYSTPHWLVEHWSECFGLPATKQLLAHQQEIPKTYLRRNLHIALPEETLPERLIPHPTLENWYTVEGKPPLSALQSGAFYATDPSTRYAVELLDPQPNEKILDACAAPGGKSASILALTQGQVDLTATDAAPHRLPRLHANLQKITQRAITVKEHDWSLPCPEAWVNQFNAVLADVPCSNSGVTQRRVDVRWRLSLKELNRLAKLQENILTHCAAAVTTGGRLVYSTCSIEAQENIQVIEKFLAHNPEWTLKHQEVIMPSTQEGDGAYAALLIRA